MVKKIEICVLLCMNACHLAEDAEMNMFKVIGRRPAMTRTHCSAMLKTFKLYMLMSCASVNHTKILQWRRPAMNKTHCAAMLKQDHVCVLLSRAALRRATNANNE